MSSVHQAFANIRKQIANKVDAGLDVLAENSQDRIKESLSTPYPPASAPDDPPHMRTGELMRSIEKSKASGGEVSVFSDCDHAVFVEYGSERMAPRPFIGREAEYLRAHGGEELSAAMRKEGSGVYQ